MESMKDKAAIVGVGYTPQGKVPGRSTLSFHLEAARNAIADAGLKVEDVDGLLIQPALPGDPTTAAMVAQYLGLNVRFMACQDTFGASAGCQAQHAAWAVAHGLANYVVCTYGENARSGGSEYGSALACRACTAAARDPKCLSKCTKSTKRSVCESTPRTVSFPTTHIFEDEKESLNARRAGSDSTTSPSQLGAFINIRVGDAVLMAGILTTIQEGPQHVRPRPSRMR